MPTTQFPEITPLPLRDQADHVFNMTVALATNLGEASRMLAGSFARNYQRGIKQGRINLAAAVEKLALDAKVNGKHIEVMALVLSAVVDAGLPGIAAILRQAEEIA